MDLIGLGVNDFLAYADGNLALASHGCVLLVGANNAGKSALLAALDVVAERDLRRPWRRLGGAGPARVSATFQPDDGERGQFVGDVADSAWLEGSVLKEIQIEWEDQRPGEMVPTSVSALDHEGVMRQVFSIRHDVSGGATVSAVPSDVFAAPPAETRWTLSQVRRGGLAGPARTELRGFLPGLAERLAAWQEWYYHFAPVRAGVQEVSQLGNIVSKLEPNGYNLAQVLLYQQSRESVEWRRIKDILSEILPDAGSLLARADGDRVEITFQDPATGTTLNVKQLGAGVEQALMAVYVGVTQPVGSVVVMEEPEAGLHPAAQRLLLRHLQEWTKTRQFVIATHSSVFLDHSDEAGVDLHLVRRTAGVSSLTRSAVKDAALLQELGVRLSDIASAERILLVEGESDAAVLQAWFPNTLQSSHVAIIGVDGGDKAWHTDVIGRVVSEADALARTVLFVRDRDELDPDAVAALEASPNIYVTQRRELENYLLDAEAIAEVLRAHDGFAAPSASEVQAALPVAADSLRQSVLIKMVAQRLPVIRILDRATTTDLVRDNATVDDVVGLILQRHETRDDLAERVRIAWAEAEQRLASEWQSRKLELAPARRSWRRSGVGSIVVSRRGATAPG